MSGVAAISVRVRDFIEDVRDETDARSFFYDHSLTRQKELGGISENEAKHTSLSCDSLLE